jgi:hypothetical protein
MIILEVMDKEPPLGEILLPLAIAGVIGYLLCWWRPQALIVALPGCVVIAGILTSEITDEFVGPAIRSEDPVYWYTSLIVAIACCLAPLLGSVVSYRRIHRSRPQEGHRTQEQPAHQSTNENKN